MPYDVPATADWNPDIDELVEAGFRRVRGLTEQIDGNSRKSVFTAMRLMLQDWANRRINYWLMRKTSVAIVAGTATYTLATDTIGVTDANVLWNGIDQPLNIVGRGVYEAFPDKNLQSMPTSMFINRQRDSVTVTLYPVPSGAAALNLWRIVKFRDIGRSDQNLDLPMQFYPAAVAGIAYYFGLDNAGMAAERLAMIKQEYDDQLERATNQDDDGAPLQVIMTGEGAYFGR